ncbi:hypothetical protein AB32_2577 [Escherichia coli 2-316-03_S1_C2]|nr:hypothetical protein HMPREF1599_02387 [Escherichia coli 907713]ESD84267.1 hypothetical protein HMPREF1613_04218 [Escherichia coli 908616]EZJ99373.1 hypothetical protein AB72_2215 [Escherichia coli 1-250-04_S1_C3]KDA73453.1 hypothetical protein AC12_2577 [Escherichia coli 2-005-03_S3_C2]KEJ25738.1 hypothetical protein AB03_2578 [Escherichia coli 2-316-03_S1_C1]KEJ27320.1 hypothetical protein AB32_2577 [Escherichia coli 2-316-03_S1_C2]KXG98893.1 hypothetical protein HMPREF3040_02353 [Escheri
MFALKFISDIINSIKIVRIIISYFENASYKHNLTTLPPLA